MLDNATKSNILRFDIFLYKAIPIVNAILSISLFIFSVTLLLGFLRTILTAPYQHTPPLTLLKTGKHFFWRLLGFWVLYIIADIILARLTFSAVKLFIPIRTNFFESAKVSAWLYQLCYTVAMLLLAKLWLFTPSLIIVHDCKFSKGLKFLKYCKLFESKELIAMFALSLAGSWLWVFLPIKHIWHIVPYTIQHFIFMIVSVMAVRFVASLNLQLPYDIPVKSLDSQGLLKT